MVRRRKEQQGESNQIIPHPRPHYPLGEGLSPPTLMPSTLLLADLCYLAFLLY